MPWVTANPEGGLAGWGAAPHLEAGNISGIVGTLVGERLKREQQFQQGLAQLGQVMQQRKYDQIANAAADQLASQSGISAPPMTGAAGEGTERLNAVKALIAGKTYPTDVGQGIGTVPLSREEAVKFAIEKPYREMQTKHLQALIDQESGGAGGAPKGKVWSDTLGGYVTPEQKYNADVKASPQYDLFHRYGMKPEELYPPDVTTKVPATSGFLGFGAQPEQTKITPGVKRGRYVKDPVTQQAVWQDDATGDQVNVGGNIMPLAHYKYYLSSLPKQSILPTEPGAPTGTVQSP